MPKATFERKIVCLQQRKNTLFCGGAFYFFSFCPHFTFGGSKCRIQNDLHILIKSLQLTQLTRFVPLLPPYEQPFGAKRKKVKCAAAKKIFSPSHYSEEPQLPVIECRICTVLSLNTDSVYLFQGNRAGFESVVGPRVAVVEYVEVFVLLHCNEALVNRAVGFCGPVERQIQVFSHEFVHARSL